MGSARWAWALLVAAGLAGGDAEAQQSPRNYKPQPLNLHRERLGSEGLGEVARTRMKNGDCPGAIEAFDAALRTSAGTSLRRDRGICHEQLGHAYPAMDDYRAYLAMQPDARDADSIRERLAALEQSNLGYSSASTDAPGDVEGGAASKTSESPGAAPAPPSESGSASASGSAGVSSSGSARAPSATSLARLDYIERDDDPLQTPLRRGRGWSIEPFFSEHKWGASPGMQAFAPGASASFGDHGTWAESVSLQVRRSFGASSAVLLEAGYEHFNATAVDSAVVAGLTSQLAYEFRAPLDGNYDNQLVLAVGLGFEHLSVSPNTAQFGSRSVGAFVPRARGGWRHLLTASAGFDLSLDLGMANFFAYSDFPFDSRNQANYLVGLNAGLLWGL
ncbi:MAG: tetratricopeptide repeat protein [Myxococcales bacterium]|nr:tetratricopeptide repeat protein [Myxococcales bacterium]